MSILDLNTGRGSSPRNKKAAKIWLGVGLLVAVLGTGSTLAANITLNGGTATESGQGVQAVVFCGGSSQTVTATPFSSYKNTATSPKFTIAGIKISGIPKACDNTDFIITAYPAGSDPTPTSALSVSSTMSSAAVLWLDGGTSKFPKASNPSSLTTNCDANPASTSTTNVTSTGALLSTNRLSYTSGCTFGYISGVTADTGSSSSGTGSFTITFNPSNSLADATSLAKITVETQNDVLGTNLKPCTPASGPNFNCSSGTLGLSA